MVSKVLVALVAIWLSFDSGDASGQVLIANDDGFGVPYAEPLVVEAFGVLDNDTLDDESAGESGATAQLVTDVSHGTLMLNTNGSFTYSPAAGFDGMDQFTYRAEFAGATPSEATVFLTACTGGPDVFACWKEAAFLASAASFGFGSFREGFEDDTTWGQARSPNTALSVTSQGVQWQANDVFRTHVPDHDPVASMPNAITTGSGAARTGQWGIFDRGHGYATGSQFACDIDNPPDSCRFHDGVTGVRPAGLEPLNGVGGYFDGTHGANVAIILDGDEANPVAGGKVVGPYQFFGAIDARPAGFSQFEFRETDGKAGQALFVFGDDFTIVGESVIAVPALSEPRRLVLVVLIGCVSALALSDRRRSRPRRD